MLKVFLGIPAHSCQITAPTALAIGQTIEQGAREGYPLTFKCHGGDADIARARNALLGLFLQSDCTHFWGVDADVSWGEGALKRLLSHGKDFVCGVYRQRTDEVVAYPVQWPAQKRMIMGQSGYPLLQAELVPAGFNLYSRACIETMAAASERWVEIGTDPVLPQLRYPFLFDWMWQGDKRRSEDYTFCLKWRELGREIWVDPSLPLGHTGMKTFEGDLMASLAREVKEHQQHIEPLAPMSLIERAKAALAGP